MESCIRGYHVYQRIWYPVVGDIAITVREEGNVHDRHAIAILEDTCCCVGHLPQHISKECYYFLKMGGVIKVEVTGQRRQSDLLEHEENMIKQARQLLEHKGFSEASVTKEAASTDENTPRSKKRKAETRGGRKGKKAKSQH